MLIKYIQIAVAERRRTIARPIQPRQTIAPAARPSLLASPDPRKAISRPSSDSRSSRQHTTAPPGPQPERPRVFYHLTLSLLPLPSLSLIPHLPNHLDLSQQPKSSVLLIPERNRKPGQSSKTEPGVEFVSLFWLITF